MNAAAALQTSHRRLRLGAILVTETQLGSPVVRPNLVAERGSTSTPPVVPLPLPEAAPVSLAWSPSGRLKAVVLSGA